jgi:predicted  nucleic acid-binding Zn-ribbon protein
LVNNSLAFLYRRWYLFRSEKYRGRFMVDERFFEEKFSALKAHIDARIDGIESRMDNFENRLAGVENRLAGVENRLAGVENRLAGVENRLVDFENRIIALEKRMETAEKLMQQIWVEVEAIRSDMRLIAEGHVMLTEKFGRFESEYIRHATEMRHDVLTLYKLTFGELERRVRELEKLKKVS